MKPPATAQSKPREVRRARIERGVLVVVALASLVWSGWWWAQIAQTPAATLLVDRTASGLAAAYEQALARDATPEVLAARITARLDEEPRDWVVIEALRDLAEAQGIALPLTVQERIAVLDAEDNGWIATGVTCAACAWDLRDCDLSSALACGVAVNLTVLGDLVALTREGARYLAGDAVDQVDVALAFVGLGATGLAVMTGGTSLAVKGGAALLRVAHRTGRLAPEILAVFRRAFVLGIDWTRLPAVRSADELAGLARPAVLRPAVAVAQDLGRLNARLGTRQALHLMGALDTPAEVARIGRAAEALGPRTLGAFDVLGKSRFLRLSVRLSDEVWAVMAGLFSAMTSMLGLMAPLLARLGRGIGRTIGRGALRLAVRVLIR